MRWLNAGVIASVVAHAGIAVAVAFMPKTPPARSHVMAVVESKKKDDKKKDDSQKDEPPPPPPKPAAPRPLPKANPLPAAPPPPAPVAAAPKAAQPAAAALAAMPNLGISMSGGTGPGIAVPQGDPAAAAQPGNKPAEAPKAAAPKQDDCTEDPVKPKPLGAVQPAYTEAARSAGVEGKVRVQLTVDESGAVSAASVMSGLGYGLDEAAVSAAKRMKFNPGTRCGRPVASRFVVSMRFALE